MIVLLGCAALSVVGGSRLELYSVKHGNLLLMLLGLLRERRVVMVQGPRLAWVPLLLLLRRCLDDGARVRTSKRHATGSLRAELYLGGSVLGPFVALWRVLHQLHRLATGRIDYCGDAHGERQNVLRRRRRGPSQIEG